MNKRGDPRCPFVNNEKSSVFCGEYRVDPEACLRCGWHPAEHERRVKLLRAGVVKTFLHIDVEHLPSLFASGYKNSEAEADDVYEGEKD